MATELNTPADSAPSDEQRSILRVFPRRLNSRKLLIILWTIEIITVLITSYGEATGPLKPAMTAIAAVGIIIFVTVFILLWAGFWALVGRLTRQKACFVYHLNVALCSLLVSSASGQILTMIEFAFGWHPYSFSAIVSIGLWILILIWTLSAHLHRATMMKSRTIWIGAASFILVLAAAIGFAWRVARIHYALDPGDFPSVYPAAFKLVKSGTTDRHLTRLDDLQKTVDKLAAAGKNS